MLRVIALASYTKGGLGDVTLLPTDEFDAYYLAMILHSDQVRKQTEDEMKKAHEKQKD